MSLLRAQTAPQGRLLQGRLLEAADLLKDAINDQQSAVCWPERVSKSLGQGPRSLGSEYLEVCESLGTGDETPREEQVEITPKN